MSDLKNFMKLFDKTGIKYKLKKDDLICLTIDDNNLIDYQGSFGKALDIWFNLDEKFLGFEPWGE